MCRQEKTGFWKTRNDPKEQERYVSMETSFNRNMYRGLVTFQNGRHGQSVGSSDVIAAILNDSKWKNPFIQQD
jgi:hypothetical protein